jgi:alpha-1,2-mannosyltransferase
MAADRGTSSDITDPQARLGRREDGARARRRPGEAGPAGSRPVRYWLSPQSAAILLPTVLALGIRLFTLTRPGFLTGISEYDDGVYLGAAIRLTQGVLPYRDFAFVQPPGILLVMTPAAVVAKVAGTATAMSFARLLTVCASTACVPLAGNLVRHRGTLVTAVTCGILAVYPDDIAAAHTLLLEPWMNLFCLIAATAAFSHGMLARPARLAWAGAALGVAGAVKFWAVVPGAILLVLCLIAGEQRMRRTWACLAGLVAGFVLPVAPFVLAAPLTFIRSTLLYQASRVGTVVPVSLRLAHVTGLVDVLNGAGKLSLHSGAHSLFARSVLAGISSASAGLLPLAVTAVLAAAIGAGYLRQWRRLDHLDWFSLATAAFAGALILGYSAFFYHYPAFVAPWLALVAGRAAGGLASSPRFQRALLAVFAVVILGVAALQLAEVAPLRAQASPAAGRLIPSGACVVTDKTILTISANRFAPLRADCPDIIDSLATTLVLSHGISVQGGAANSRAVVAAWQSILGRAGYVWLSPENARRIPWTHELSSWFQQNFRPTGPYSPATGQLYVRVN